jgi:hypothetical protein
VQREGRESVAKERHIGVRFASPQLASRLILSLIALRALSAAAAPFDLSGPTLEVQVTRGARTLPIAQVPNLASGDHLVVKADLPAGASAHYLMVAAFLRGATNPPPQDWFFSCESWTRRCAKDGLSVTVPQDAGQLLIFLAPQTGGAYSTLLDTVRGRPGVFVRTSQDLNQAALDHARLEAYLAAVRHLGDADPSQLKESVPLLSRSLAIKVDESCLGKIPVLQAPCLAQGRESLILDDGRGASLAQTLTSGPASDLAMEASNTPQLKSGYYGPFIGSIIDIAKILDSLHTARYQYLPALTSMHGQQVALSLNAPPSFHDPKSVLVVALPPIEAPQFPALHPVNASEILCPNKDPLVLPVDGAPVVFATAYAHDAVLHLNSKEGTSVDLPARADPARGGFAVTLPSSGTAATTGTATLRAQWGFDRYEGPSFRLADPQSQVWRLAPADSSALTVGRTNTLHLRAESVSCLDEVTLVDSAAKAHKVEWKKIHPNEVELTVPLQDAPAGDLTLRVSQFGRPDPQTLPLRATSADSPRPSAELISRTIQWSGAGLENSVQLSNESTLPLGARLNFSIRAQTPAGFSSDERIEVATTDGVFSAVLGVSTGQVVLESRKVAVVTLDPAKALGASAFGPLQFRRIVQGAGGEWVPLVTLVRLPKLSGVYCTADPDVGCSLTGADLFLLDSVSVDADFTRATRVPDGYTAAALRIAHPLQGRLYVKLRDDPGVVNVANVNVKTAPAESTAPPSPGPEHLSARPEAASQLAVSPPQRPQADTR